MMRGRVVGVVGALATPANCDIDAAELSWFDV